MRVSIDEAARKLNAGENVVIPTETVYGLGASIYHSEAIAGIFKIKNRPKANPLIVHVASVSDLRFAKTDLPHFQLLVEAFWPGPLTMVLPLIEAIDPQITAGLHTVAVRSPKHPDCLDLLKRTGPLVAPSANPSGRPSPTEAEHVERDYQGAIPVLDGGRCSCGVESTIIAWDPEVERWALARLGSLNPEVIESLLGYRLDRRLKADVAICPGQKWRHYAPNTKLHLFCPSKDMPVVGFENRAYSSSFVYSLGNDQKPETCLENLYDILRRLDLDKIEQAWIDMDFPKEGLWETLRERLTKASS